MDNVDILIVGSGPAGISTALHLVQQNPDWAHRITIVDKAVHPREKLCGGGITRSGLAILDSLGLDFEPAHIPVQSLYFVYRNLQFVIEDSPVFRVVRRDEFDHWMVQKAEEKGIDIRQGEAVIGISPQSDFVDVTTTEGTFRAKILVAADGSNSFVRQKLRWDGKKFTPKMARLLEVLTPEDKNLPAFENGSAIFDFSPQTDGVQGYVWEFPSLIQGNATMNRGVFDSRVHSKKPRPALKEVLRRALSSKRKNLDDVPLKGFPIHYFDVSNEISRPRILLAGDAAGADPFVGEGIAFALGYGTVAADAIIGAFEDDDFSLSDYKARVLADPLLSVLPTRLILAKILYGTPIWIQNFAWLLLPVLTRFLARYNARLMPFAPTTRRLR